MELYTKFKTGDKMEDILIDVNGLYFSYEDDLNIIENLNVLIKKGSITSVLGHNGAGKTTLFKLILGLLKAKNGDVSVTKNYISKRNQIAYMPENGGIYTNLTVYENLKFKAGVFQIPKKQQNECIDSVLKELNLYKRKNIKVDKLSNGLKKRTSLACTLIGKPKLLILDEPSNAIDPESLDIIIKVLKRLNASGTTILYSTHDLNLAKELSTEVVIINKGRVKLQKSVDSLPENLKEIYLKITKEREEEEINVVL